MFECALQAFIFTLRFRWSGRRSTRRRCVTSGSSIPKGVWFKSDATQATTAYARTKRCACFVSWTVQWTPFGTDEPFRLESSLTSSLFCQPRSRVGGALPARQANPGSTSTSSLRLGPMRRGRTGHSSLSRAGLRYQVGAQTALRRPGALCGKVMPNQCQAAARDGCPVRPISRGEISHR